MCGRFTLRTKLNILLQKFSVESAMDQQQSLFRPRYNIAPTQEIFVVRQQAAGRELATMRWGLVPSWSKEISSGPPLINARADSVATKPSFRTAFKKRRCLIPADGFYEWKKTEGSKKQPYYIHRPDNKPFAFAGLWERWERGPTIESCTIVTTDANRRIGQLHDRMPVILADDDYAEWLDPTVDDPAALQHLLTPCGEDELIAEPVSTHVNRVANDDPKCVEVHFGRESDGLLF